MSEALPTITVVTICRNVLPALTRTVESVLAQGYPGLEYWIVDGASTDGTPAYLETLASRGVRTLSEPDRGISDAMNKGIRLATGDWIAHLHADDTYLPGALETLGRAAATGDADVITGWMIKREPSGDVLCRTAPERLAIEMAVPHPGTLTRRTLFESLGGFDTNLRNAMDYDFFLRAKVTGARFRAVEKPVVVVAWGGQSERSLWRTLRETHEVRRRRLASGWSRSGLFLAFLYGKGVIRDTMQRAGLASLVAWYRRNLSIPRKG
jgi:glycosyltransferase involved in cell wall biosynthesis